MRTSQTVPFRSLRLLLLCGAASVALYGASCSSSGEDGEVDPEYEDVIYEGETNDEALAVLVAATPAGDAAKTPLFDSPMEGEMVDGATPPKFSWHVGASAARPSAPALRFAAPLSPSRTSPLAELLGPERAAHAHGEPFNGKGYWLEFSSMSEDKLVRVFTDETSYTPETKEWEKIKAGGSITVSITMGIFTENNLDSDGGPWKGKALHFTVK